MRLKLIKKIYIIKIIKISLIYILFDLIKLISKELNILDRLNRSSIELKMRLDNNYDSGA